MLLSRPKTQSQQDLAVKLRLEPSAGQGILNWERKRLLILAAKTALSASLCWWIALRLGLHDGYWGSISTLIGAAFGFTFSLFGTLPWNYIAAVLLAIILCGLLGLRNSSRLAGVTITIIMLVQSSSSHWLLALHRVGEVLLGIIVAILVSTLVFPDRARLRLRDGLAQEFLVLGTFFESILQGFGGQPAANLAELHQDSLAMLRGNNTLLD